MQATVMPGQTIGRNLRLLAEVLGTLANPAAVRRNCVTAKARPTKRGLTDTEAREMTAVGKMTSLAGRGGRREVENDGVMMNATGRGGNPVAIIAQGVTRMGPLRRRMMTGRRISVGARAGKTSRKSSC